MGSKGRFPPPQWRHPGIEHGMVHSDPYGPPPMHPSRGGFSHLDMLPPVEVMEQKLAGQHGEMQKLATENQRLASTHGTLRQELGAAQHELHGLHGHIRDMKSESEQQKRGLMDNIARMGAELRASDSIKGELQAAQTEAQKLISTRQELVSKVQQLGRELQMAHSDVQQIPTLLSELDGLRQEYQHCRATYDYEKKVYNDHLESLQVMEKNYVAMAGEVEKLRAQLSNASKFDPRAGTGAGGSYPGYNENDAAGNYSMVQNAYGNAYGYGHGYSSSQGQGHLSGGVSSGVAADATAAVAGVTPPTAGAQSGTVPTSAPLPPPPPTRPAYDGSGNSNYDSQRGPAVPGYDAQRVMTGGPGYDAQRVATAPVYEAIRGPGQDIQRGGPGYDAQWRMSYDGRSTNFDGHGQPQYDAQRGSAYDPQRSVRYDVSSSGASAPQGQVAPVHNVYGSVTPPAHVTGAGYEALARGGANVRR